MPQHEIALAGSTTELQTVFERELGQLPKMLPGNISREKLKELWMLAVSRQPELLRCTVPSLVKAFKASAECGLPIGGVLGKAYLLPFKNNKMGGALEATFIPGYRGLIDMAVRTGRVKNIEAKVVYEKDQFDVVFGNETRIVHRPVINGERGGAVCVYAIAHLSGGGVQADMMLRSDVDKVRAMSKARDAEPWTHHYEEMMRKTMIRKLWKQLPGVESNELMITDGEFDLSAAYPEVKPVENRTAALANRMPDEPPPPTRKARQKQKPADTVKPTTAIINAIADGIRDMTKLEAWQKMISANLLGEGWKKRTLTELQRATEGIDTLAGLWEKNPPQDDNDVKALCQDAIDMMAQKSEAT